MYGMMYVGAHFFHNDGDVHIFFTNFYQRAGSPHLSY